VSLRPDLLAVAFAVAALAVAACSDHGYGPLDEEPGADAAALDGGDGGDVSADGDAVAGDDTGGDGDVGTGDGAVAGDGDEAMDGDEVSDSDAMADGDEDTAADGDSETGQDWRSSLAICWTDSSCPRVMAIGHGGLWNVSSAPYDSDAAIAAAYEGGMDGVKIDVRVTSDNVPVIAHSSPIEIYESLDCYGRKIEEMTAAEVTSCHRVPSATETFQRLDDVLGTLRGKMVVQLCVKESTDYGRTIEEIRAQGAEDFAFIELSTSDLQNVVPSLPGSDSVYYLVNVGSNLAEVDTLIDVIQNPRAFMVEIDPDVDLGDLVATRIHPAGLRSFTYDSAQVATVAHLQGLFETGFDVVSSNAGANDVQARINANQSRGVSPP